MIRSRKTGVRIQVHRHDSSFVLSHAFRLDPHITHPSWTIQFSLSCAPRARLCLYLISCFIFSSRSPWHLDFGGSAQPRDNSFTPLSSCLFLVIFSYPSPLLPLSALVCFWSSHLSVIHTLTLTLSQAGPFSKPLFSSDGLKRSLPVIFCCLLVSYLSGARFSFLCILHRIAIDNADPLNLDYLSRSS